MSEEETNEQGMVEQDLSEVEVVEEADLDDQARRWRRRNPELFRLAKRFRLLQILLEQKGVIQGGDMATITHQRGDQVEGELMTLLKQQAGEELKDKRAVKKLRELRQQGGG